MRTLSELNRITEEYNSLEEEVRELHDYLVKEGSFPWKGAYESPCITISIGEKSFEIAREGPDCTRGCCGDHYDHIEIPFSDLTIPKEEVLKRFQEKEKVEKAQKLALEEEAKRKKENAAKETELKLYKSLKEKYELFS